jgi:hypothetical protein
VSAKLELLIDGIVQATKPVRRDDRPAARLSGT